MLQNVLKKTGGWTIAMILFVVLYLSANTVKWETNEHLVNQTDEFNQTISVARQHYTRLDPVPVAQFRSNSMGAHFTMEDVGIIFFVLIIYTIIMRFGKEYSGNLVTEEKAKQEVDNYLRKDKDIKSFKILKQSYLQRMAIDDQESKPFSRWVFAEVDYISDKDLQCLAFDLDPYTNYLNRTCDAEITPHGIQAVCHNCGSFPNLKLRTSEGFKELREKWGVKNR